MYALSNDGVLRRPVEPKTYTSEEFQHALERGGIVCSMSRRGNCYDNAVVESFFGVTVQGPAWRRCRGVPSGTAIDSSIRT